MREGRVAGTELMPRREVDYTELDGSNLKKGKGFLKPNLRVGSNGSLTDSNFELAISHAQVKPQQRVSPSQLQSLNWYQTPL